jgi:hypothetical protein
MELSRLPIEKILIPALGAKKLDIVAQMSVLQNTRDFGQLEPVTVRSFGIDRYVLVDGLNRLLAAIALGQEKIVARLERTPEVGLKEHAEVWVVMTNDDPHAVFTRKDDANSYVRKLEAEDTSASAYAVRFNPKEPDFEVGTLRTAIIERNQWDTPAIYKPETRRIYKVKQGVYKGMLPGSYAIWCFGTLSDLVSQIVAVRDLLQSNKEVKYVTYESTRDPDTA